MPKVAIEGRGEGGAAKLLHVLTQPLCAWRGPARWLALTVVVLLGVGVALAVVLSIAPLSAVFHAPDSFHYLKLAAGHTVMQPFASRQLGARVAALLGRLPGGDLHAGFLAEATLSLVFALAATVWLALQTLAPRWMLAALVLVASWPLLVQYLVLPDLWYAALLAALLVLLERELWLAAALIMLPLMLSRESASLTLVCFILAGWARWPQPRRWLYAAVAVASAVVGTLIVSRLNAGSQPNVEHLPEVIYVFAKVPWNFLRNVLGIIPWSDANPELCRVPVWSTPLHLGPVHAVGICGFSWLQQLAAVDNTLRLFGVLPLMAAVLWWRHRHWQGRSVLLRFALLYGGVSFLLAPVLGAGFGHLMQYAWPLFLVAVPRLLDEFTQPSLTTQQAAASVGVLAVHLALPWILLVPGLGQRIALGLLLWAVGYWLLQSWLGGTPQQSQKRANSPELARG
ncbi:hypothetical protein GOB94_07290 [Granulicella sp. 5B5]|uniref:hypothetical protein n=1 Tax=Granulicella sp. 5B5 TaxID=1617967 RepID=UPI0015F60BD5|nr:hypothetical protein [Granulicella sp. 5B5]QMV18512.1 hypothetical protein GOB94_07290 [Granulicella sp. 5B5]